MSRILLLDFGASRVKCALWSFDTEALVDEIEIPSPVPQTGPAGEVEVEPEHYWAALEATAGVMVRKHPGISVAWVCSEMHGVILADESGQAVSRYISWRDERAALGLRANASDKCEKFGQKSDAFAAKSGMSLRAGLPWLTLCHFKEHGILPERKLRIFTLVDWLLWRGGEQTSAIHPSLAAGTGFFDYSAGQWSDFLFALGGFDRDQFLLPNVVEVGHKLGSIKIAGCSLTLFGGLGDLQTAAFGAGFPSQADMIVNLGTGSQVLAAGLPPRPGIDIRPGVSGRNFAAITHIPSGRALNVLAACLDGLGVLGGGKPFFWDEFAKLDVALVLNATLEVDLAVFTAARGYRNGGAIANINEGRFAPGDLLTGIARGWLMQYVAAMNELDPEQAIGQVLLAGGLSRRAGFIGPVLSALSGRRVQAVTSLTGEETLDGLLSLARNHRRGI